MTARRSRGLLATLVWLVLLALLITAVIRARYSADLSAFLPSKPTPEQAVLIDQLKEGPASRLILIGVETDDRGPEAASGLARLSKSLASALRKLPALPGDKVAPFASVNNGEPVAAQRDQELLLRYRYLMSPDVTPARFQPEGLRLALQDSLDLLGSSAGLMLQPLLTRDPTAELVHLVEAMDSGGERATVDGVWVSPDQKRAVLVAQTQAEGSDLDAQQRAIDAIRQQFGEAQKREGLKQTRLVVSGPAVFATDSRQTIESEATRLASIGFAIIIALLLSVYRSLRALLLGLLPMITGALAGIAAVSWGFGMVHGITLGFGITLIGEAVDYAIYLFVQGGAQATTGARHDGRDVAGFWPTISLGVLTSVIGFASMLASGFPGLAQLGLFSIVGVISAALVTRYLLPHLIPEGFKIRPTPVLDRRLTWLTAKAPAARWLVPVLLVAAVAVLWTHRDRLWSRELTSLSPITAEAQALDMRLRADLGAPDVRYLGVIRAPTMEAALQGAEQASAALAPLVDSGMLLGTDSPARYLPSQAMQRQRQAALPDTETLRAHFMAAAKGLPLKTEKFEGFFVDAAQAKALPLLTRDDLQGSSLSLGVDSLLMRQSGQWTALVGLRLPSDDAATGQPTQPVDAARIRSLLKSSVKVGEVHFIDLKAESEKLYSDYLSEVLFLSMLGAGAIVILLGVVLRSPRRLLRVVTPLLCTVIIVTGGLVATGPPLTLFHLVGLLLIVAIGSNYALFFDQRTHRGTPSASILSSMLFANLSTVAGFGMLAWSQVPVLHAIGATVGPGAILALVLSAVLHHAVPGAAADQV
ncbi:MMPL family transporter [Aquabacterium sp.]|uniref:MMPL family transporter n=1 Tax=Aquabacterium sp. TaxID=1872578 RepID=UPI00248770D8|nr:MMPL family transporter [Aquabacterium sp.]MDI1258445.1 MMPL family transporter [Aquabacterium sp.]